MRTAMVAGNWKLNGTRKMAAALVADVAQGADGLPGVEIVVCPPFPLLPAAAKSLADKSVALGAQNLSEHDQGAFTGEVSGAMLTEFGCKFVIVGHSERRTLFGESDAIVARKFTAAQRHGLVPILCVGETLEEREQERTEEVVARQLQAVLDVTGIQAFGQAVVAYEPVWAIGTGRSASAEQAQAVHAFIREKISGQDATISGALRILYGGSVKASNAAGLFGMADIDGGLIGGASLDGEEFLSICRAAG
jgi:triosephosphate isomerase (TIM)